MFIADYFIKGLFLHKLNLVQSNSKIFNTVAVRVDGAQSRGSFMPIQKEYE